MMTALNWTIGPYRIVREIDRGQFGTVYEASDAEGREIALKLVPVQGADSDEKVSAERQGAQLQQRFSRGYKGLVPEVLHHERIDPYYAIAMELVRGEPLTTVIKGGRVPPQRAATIACGICDFLEKAHEFTINIEDQSESLIVHGDLKPAHILLLADGSLRVLDFGIAKALAARKAATTNKWGSVDYASPERLESGRVNEQVDFWSLGVMLFEMLAGCRPYMHYEHNQSRLETAIRRQEPRLRVPPDVDARLTAVVDKLLASQVDRRYQSARHIGQDLRAFLNGDAVVAAAEAARADQATVRIPHVIATAPRREPTIATEPLAPRHAAPAAVVATEALPRAAQANIPPPIPVLPPPVIPPLPVLPAAGLAGLPPMYKPGTAAVLSLLIPGFGQLYNGDYLRGVFWLVITPGFWIGSAGTFGWPFHLISSYTAYRRAVRRSAAARTATTTARGASFLGRRGAPLLMLAALMLFASEGISFVRAQQLRDQVSTLDGSDVGAVRTAYRRVGRSPLGLGTAVVSRPLKQRLVAIADRTILEFRAETPALDRGDWERARDCLDLALEISPGDTRVAAKRQYVDGRLTWMSATNRSGIDRAIRLLRDAARLDPASPDPYLGLATIHAYSTRDLPALTQAISDAEARGYARGRRERAELGDVHKVLGDRSRAEARRASGSERDEHLQQAAESYGNCIEQLDGLGLGSSERTLNDCRRRLDAVKEEIAHESQGPFDVFFRFPLSGV
jgi:hypothetical protein